MEVRGPFCTNCGREHKPWLHLLMLSSGNPLDPKDPSWRCTRCRPRRDDGKRLSCRIVRERYGLTQHNWSRAIGVDVRTVVRWESGSPAPVGRALEMLAVLDCAADLNPGSILIVRDHVRSRKSYAELVASLLVKAAGGIVRPKRKRKPQPPRPDGLVVLKVRVSPSERQSLERRAIMTGSNLSSWARLALVRSAVKIES